MNSPQSSPFVVAAQLQGDWTTAIICTFGANLTFFESNLLGQLSNVPLRIVLADDAQLRTTLEEDARTGQHHRRANTVYVLGPIRHTHAAHGKLLLLLGPSSGKLIVGSGNLGYEGYAAPGELWHVFAYADDDQRHIDEFASARAFLDGLGRAGHLDPPVIELLTTAWGLATWLPPGPRGTPAVSANLETPVLDMLTTSTTGSAVDELVTHAPFHDPDCAALRQAIATFDPKHVRVLVSDDTSVDPACLTDALTTARASSVEHVTVRDDTRTYIHAKWLHLRHADSSETLLSGSANLSRAALLRRPQDGGNIEIAVITRGERGAFEALYDHLERRLLPDPSRLSLRCHSDEADDAGVPDFPCLSWSQLDRRRLTLVFDRILPDDAVVELFDRSNRALGSDPADRTHDKLTVTLDTAGADTLAQGGAVVARIDGDDEKRSMSWPYQIQLVRGRLDRVGQSEQLQHIADLPRQDAELLKVLRSLERTLLIDRASMWLVCGGKATPEDVTPEDADAIRLEDLDWPRARRDPRYTGYLMRSAGAGPVPSDIQVILAAIAGRLGDIGRPDVDPEDDPPPGDAPPVIDVEADPKDEENEHHEPRRQSVASKTRHAFERFIRRYAAALADSQFMEALGPIHAATNAVVFDFLTAQLLDRGAVRSDRVEQAQLATWRFLWGDSSAAPMWASNDPDTREAVLDRLEETGARQTTLKNIAGVSDLLTGDSTPGLREAVRHIITSRDFGLDSDLLIGIAGDRRAALGLLGTLSQIAGLDPESEVIPFVLEGAPGCHRGTEWRTDVVRRRRRDARVPVLVVPGTIDDLTPDRAHGFLRRWAAGVHYTDLDTSYLRIKFEGNDRAIAFWDDDARDGLVLFGDTQQPLAEFAPEWPEWAVRIDELRADLKGSLDARIA